MRETGWLLWSWPEGVGEGINHVLGSPDALHGPRHRHANTAISFEMLD